MVDAHFRIISRQIEKFIREKDLGVLIPDDVSKALTYDGGVDVVKVNRQARRVLNGSQQEIARRLVCSIALVRTGIFSSMKL